jgi:uroporphyrinogen-III decarboxylase
MDDDEAQYIIDEIAEILNDTPLATDEEIFNTLHEFMPGISQEKMSEYISWTKAFYNY